MPVVRKRKCTALPGMRCLEQDPCSLYEFPIDRFTPDSSVLFAAKRRAGKSVLITYLWGLLRDNWDFAAVYTKTRSNGWWQRYVNPVFVIDGFDADRIRHWMHFMGQLIERYTAALQKWEAGHAPDEPPPVEPPFLVILLEDLAADREAMRRSEVTDELYVAGRHSNISIWTTTQYVLKASPEKRDNSDLIFVSSMQARKNIEAVADNWMGGLDRCLAMRVIREVTAVPNQFLVIDANASGTNPYNRFFRIRAPTPNPKTHPRTWRRFYTFKMGNEAFRATSKPPETDSDSEDDM